MGDTVEKKTIGAKDQSRVAMVFSAIWIGVGTVAKGLGLISLEISDIILSGLAIAGCFVPVYFSIIMDKIKDIKLGKVA